MLTSFIVNVVIAGEKLPDWMNAENQTDTASLMNLSGRAGIGC